MKAIATLHQSCLATPSWPQHYYKTYSFSLMPASCWRRYCPKACIKSTPVHKALFELLKFITETEIMSTLPLMLNKICLKKTGRNLMAVIA